MKTVSDRDFEIMVDQLLGSEEVKFDMLATIVENHLKEQVNYWCRTDLYFRGKNTEIEKEIMQGLHIRIMRTVITSFLLKDGVEGGVNYHPDGFSAWLYTVAKNYTFDYLERAKKRVTVSYEEIEDVKIKNEDQDNSINDDFSKFDCCDNDYERERLCRCFDIVLESDMSIYKTLTWLAQSLIMLNLDVTRIKSTDHLVKILSDKTLFEMRSFVYALDDRISWLDITPDQRKKIDSALSSVYKANPQKEGVLWGEMKYGDFYMSKGDKASISDWVNKINKMIKRRLANETLDN